MKTPQAPTIVSEKVLRALLDRHKCPRPLAAVRAMLMGNIASPVLDLSPLAALTAVWAGQLPSFETPQDAEAFFNALIAGLWNQLAEHQSSRNPFRLHRTPVEPTREALLALASTRTHEVAGFLDGLFGGEGQLHLPHKAHQAVETLVEVQGMFAGATALLADETKPTTAQSLAEFARNAQEMTAIAEVQINKAVQACKRARASQLEPMAAMPTHRHVPLLAKEGEPPFVMSPLSQPLSRNGMTVQVEIYRDEEGQWILEVVDEQNTSHVWDDHFGADHQALAAAIRALEEAPMEFVAEPTSSHGVH
ncbi:MAG TPA: hypothetical protein VFP68_16165 [Burkholderiaceae bacterium]|nr:hypothetical protein [Burkholderiaceae bacterium]